MGYENQEDPDCSEFVEVDPTGRYGRYNEILGKGSSKIVYRAFDEYEGIEVAWNQVRLYDFLQSPEELERLYCEIHLLKTLKHKNIMKFYASWVDTSNRNINFVTEMFTSGTLRQYRHKHRRVNLRAVKHWCRQILEGLLYLHNHNPPIIHRDLKCDNIFINGNQGEVKIGDLGLAAILRKSHAARCVGTPEFMAPEIYEEQYNELADIYSFGMCILEMVTFEYPYSECTHSAQIYKKVISGRKPEALDKVQDPEVRHFVEKCLATVSQRLPAKELLKDPFLQIDDLSSCLMEDQFSELGSLIRQPFVSPSDNNIHRVDSWCQNGFLPQVDDGRDYDAIENGQDDIELFSDAEDDFSHDVDIAIEGRMREDGHIFFWLKIADIEGRVRHIHFVFNLDVDTALSVATELVEELDITDYDVTVIAEMIDGEILSIVPDWKPGPGIDETLSFPTPRRCPNCDSNGASCASPIDHHSGRNPCSRVRCQAVTHGRFEEVTYKVDSSQPCTTEGASELSCQIGILNMTEKENCTDSESERVDPVQKHQRKSSTHSRSTSFTKEPVDLLRSGSSKDHRYLDKTEVGYQYPPPDLPDDYENEIRQELRWLKAKYQMELRDYQNQRLGEAKMHSSSYLEYEEQETKKVLPQTPPCSPLHSSKNGRLDSMHLGMRLSSNLAHGDRHPTTSTARPPTDINDRQYSAVEMFRSGQTNVNRSMESSYTTKSSYPGLLFPGCLPRTKSLPVDAVDA